MRSTARPIREDASPPRAIPSARRLPSRHPGVAWAARLRACALFGLLGSPQRPRRSLFRAGAGQRKERRIWASRYSPRRRRLRPPRRRAGPAGRLGPPPDAQNRARTQRRRRRPTSRSRTASSSRRIRSRTNLGDGLADVSTPPHHAAGCGGRRAARPLRASCATISRTGAPRSRRSSWGEERVSTRVRARGLKRSPRISRSTARRAGAAERSLEGRLRQARSYFMRAALNVRRRGLKVRVYAVPWCGSASRR